MPKRVALITGGAKGIGRAIALELASQKWSVALCYRHSKKEAEDTLKQIEARGSRGMAVQADVSDPEACKTLVQQAQQSWGQIDALIHCAGPYHRVDFFDETLEGWKNIFDGNLHSLFTLSRLVTPGMKERGWGRIITFAMAHAARDVPPSSIAAHFIAKSGVLLLTQCLAGILGPHGITANTISPGVIHSGSLPIEDLKPLIKHIPAGRLGTPADLVPVVTYLLSEDARYTNGANIVVSGGWGL